MRQPLIAAVTAAAALALASCDPRPLEVTDNSALERITLEVDNDTPKWEFGETRIFSIIPTPATAIIDSYDIRVSNPEIVEIAQGVLPNFPLISFINGVCVFDGVGIAEILLFILYCLLIGVLEECFFRGIILVWLTEIFKKNKTGLVKSMILSSCVFGLAHLFNLFGGAGVADTLLQVLYSALIGGLCAFAFFKTNNILCAVLIHFIYNVCGLIFNADIGLGTGVIYGTAAMIVTVAIGLAVGVFVVISLVRTKEEELYRFYDTVNIRLDKNDK